MFQVVVLLVKLLVFGDGLISLVEYIVGVIMRKSIYSGVMGPIGSEYLFFFT